MKDHASVAALCFCLIPALVQAQPSLGSAGLLTDGSGRVLYVFDQDRAGRSVCYDTCAAQWPPFIAAADARPQGDFDLVARNDGRRQWTLRGKPLYYYAGDGAPGQASGDGVKGVWHVVRGHAGTDATSYRPDGY